MSTTDVPPNQRSDDDRKAAAHAEFMRLVAEQRASHKPPMWWGILIGLVAAGAGLAAGEFVGGLSRSLRSPVLSVGDRVIDHVPAGLKQWAIRSFGTSDKTVLLWTIVIVIAVAAMFAGVATVRGRRDIGIGFAVLFGLAGAWAAGVGRNTRFVGVFPALVGAAVAAGVLMLGYRLAHPKPVMRSEPSSDPVITPPLDRRRFLAVTGGIALGSVLVASMGRALQDRFNASLVRAGVRAPVPG